MRQERMKRRDDDFIKKIKTTTTTSSQFSLNDDDEEEEEKFNIPKEKEGTIAALPILNSNGNWKMVRKINSNSGNVDEIDSDDSSDSSDVDDEEEQKEVEISLPKAKELMAEISISLLEGGGSLTFEDKKLTTQSQKLKTLLSFCDWKKNSVAIAKIALVSLVAIFKDILPSYSIKKITEASTDSSHLPLSRDIKDQREGEQGLLEVYESYLKILMINIGQITSSSSSTKAKSFQGRRGRAAETAARDGGIEGKMSFLLRKAHTRPIVDCSVSCLCQLIEFATHFNHYQSRILPTAFYVLSLNEGQPLGISLIERVSNSLASRISLGNKESGDGRGDERVLWIMRGLGDLVHSRQYSPLIPSCWLSIPKGIMFNKPTESANTKVPGTNAVGQKKKKHMTGKEKKEHKAKQKQLSSLIVAEDIVKGEEVKKWHTESLRQLFRIYFGILNRLKIDLLNVASGTINDGASSKEEEEMLNLVLDGLSRHAHRIGVEYYVDLMSVLKVILLEKNQKLSLLSALQCINVTDRIHSLNEALSAMDLKFLYNALYIQLWRLKPQKGRVPKIPEAIKDSLRHCMRSFFGVKRLVSVSRVIAFSQRLADLSFLLCENGGGAAMEAASFFLLLLKDLLMSQGRACESALDEETCGQGAYFAEAIDPDLCNPHSRSLMEPLKKIGVIINGWKRVGEIPEQIEVRERLFSIIKMGTK